MREAILYRSGLPMATVQALQSLIPSAVCAGLLRVIAACYAVPFDDNYAALGIISATLALGIFAPARNASYYLAERTPTALAGTVLRWLVLVAALLMLGYFLKVSAHFSRRVIGFWILATPVALIVVTRALHNLMRSALLSSRNSRRAVIVGYNELGTRLAARLKATNMNVKGYFDDRGAGRLNVNSGTHLLGRFERLADYVQSQRVDVVFIAMPIRQIPRVLALIDALRDTTASIYYVPDIYVFDLIQARTTDLFGIPVVAMCETPLSGHHGVTKRLLDVVVASVTLVLLTPLLLAIALAVKITSRGACIFRQRRYGLDGRSIVVYKFRTMTVSEDGQSVVQVSRDDRRITWLGRYLRRYSLDELPQIVNVIQGRMSLVGPRPHAVAHNEEYRKLVKGYMVRHKVLPGITGWAQVNGHRGEIADLADLQARVNHDLEYLRHWSVAMDLRIMLRTVMMVLKDEKAY